MKKWIPFFAFVMLCLPATAQEYSLVWSDEFDGPAIDTSKWTHQVFPGADSGNWELQYYTDRALNSRVENGQLVIEARKEDYGGYQYTSARLTSDGKADFLYGRVEARIQVPTGQGMWPAFWMLPTEWVYGGWPASGEIDIMETVNQTDFVAGTIHYGAPHAYAGHEYREAGVNFADDFHVYAVEWTPGAFQWSIDGVPYGTETGWWSSGGPFPAPFDQYFHLILNVAVGGTWPGPPDANTVFPQQMRVDWVRVYQLGDFPPTIAITSPTPWATAPAGPVNISTNASDIDGDLERVEFYVDNAYVGESASAPYGIVWQAAEGCHVITAIAVDAQGLTASDTTTISAGAGCNQFPYLGYPHPIPGMIEAEDFDHGVDGAVCFDSDSGNNGGAYRTNTSVDIEASSEHGFDVGWITQGEWMTYTVSVEQSGVYAVAARVASLSTGGAFRLEFDGSDLIGDISVPVTGGWQVWTTVQSEIHLSQGNHELRFLNRSGEADRFNLNYFKFDLTQSDEGEAPTEGEGEVVGEGEASIEGEIVDEGEGETISEGEIVMDGEALPVNHVPTGKAVPPCLILALIAISTHFLTKRKYPERP